MSKAEKTIEVKLRLNTHSGISNEDMLEAMNVYLGVGPRILFGEEGVTGLGTLSSAAGVITSISLEDDELVATVRLWDPEQFEMAQLVKALCEAKNPPCLSPICLRSPGKLDKVTLVVIKEGP